MKKIPYYYLFKAFFVSLLLVSFADASNNKQTRPKVQIPQDIQLNVVSTSKIYDIAVIGGGAAGVMAVNKSVFHNDDVLFVAGERKNIKQARGMWVPKFGNIPALNDIERPIVSIRNEVLKTISESIQKDKLAVLEKSIDQISKSMRNNQEVFTLTDSNGDQYQAKYVILATGMMDTQPHIADSIRPIFSFANNQQAIYCLRCDGHLAINKKNVVIIGHSNEAASGAILLAERYSIPNITILTNGEETDFTDESKSLIKSYGIYVNSKSIAKIYDKEDHKLDKVGFSDNSQINVDFAVISLGVRINNTLAKELDAELDSEGYVIADDNGLTSVKNLYVAGDLKANTRKQVYVAWDTAIRASEAINKEIRLQKRKALKS